MIARPPRRLHPLRRRATIGLLVAVWLLGLGLDWHHLATAHHARCEHGDLLDIAADASTAGVAPEVTASADTRIVRADAAAAHGHHHCDAVRRRHERSIFAAARTAHGETPQTADVRDAARLDFIPPTIPCYRLAPKNSPNA
jgi:hypothetical protein